MDARLEYYISQKSVGAYNSQAPLGRCRLPEKCTCRQSAYVMAARRLFGAAWTWTGWRTRELPVPAEPGRLLIRGYAKRPGELG